MDKITIDKKSKTPAEFDVSGTASTVVGVDINTTSQQPTSVSKITVSMTKESQTDEFNKKLSLSGFTVVANDTAWQSYADRDIFLASRTPFSRNEEWHQSVGITDASLKITHNPSDFFIQSGVRWQEADTLYGTTTSLGGRSSTRLSINDAGAPQDPFTPLIGPMIVLGHDGTYLDVVGQVGSNGVSSLFDEPSNTPLHLQGLIQYSRGQSDADPLTLASTPDSRFHINAYGIILYPQAPLTPDAGMTGPIKSISTNTSVKIGTIFKWDSSLGFSTQDTKSQQTTTRQIQTSNNALSIGLDNIINPGSETTSSDLNFGVATVTQKQINDGILFDSSSQIYMSGSMSFALPTQVQSSMTLGISGLVYGDPEEVIIAREQNQTSSIWGEINMSF